MRITGAQIGTPRSLRHLSEPVLARVAAPRVAVSVVPSVSEAVRARASTTESSRVDSACLRPLRLRSWGELGREFTDSEADPDRPLEGGQPALPEVLDVGLPLLGKASLVLRGELLSGATHEGPTYVGDRGDRLRGKQSDEDAAEQDCEQSGAGQEDGENAHAGWPPGRSLGRGRAAARANRAR